MRIEADEFNGEGFVEINGMGCFGLEKPVFEEPKSDLFRGSGRKNCLRIRM